MHYASGLTWTWLNCRHFIWSFIQEFSTTCSCSQKVAFYIDIKNCLPARNSIIHALNIWLQASSSCKHLQLQASNSARFEQLQTSKISCKRDFSTWIQRDRPINKRSWLFKTIRKMFQQGHGVWFEIKLFVVGKT